MFLLAVVFMNMVSIESLNKKAYSDACFAADLVQPAFARRVAVLLEASIYIFSCLHCLAISWLTMTSFALKSVVECTTGGCSNKSGDTKFS